VLSPTKNLLSSMPTGIDWVKHIVGQLDSGMLHKESPPKTYELSSWDSGMIREAVKSKDPGSKYYVNAWRAWIREVELTEAMNRVNLLCLLTALNVSRGENNDGYTSLILTYLKDEWRISAEDTEEYFRSTNRLKWVHDKAKRSPGPSIYERDPWWKDPEKE